MPRFVRLAVICLTCATCAGTAAAAAEAGITLSAEAGTAGTTITVTGTDFDPFAGGGVRLGSASTEFGTDEGGGFTATITVPNDPSGPVRVTATEACKEPPCPTASTPFRIAASAAADITLRPDSGAAGKRVTVIGSGFDPGASGTLTLGSATASFRTSDTGRFKSTIVVPRDEPGDYDLTAAESCESCAHTSRPFRIDATTVGTAFVTVDPGAGRVGGSVQIGGGNWKRGTPVQLFLTIDGRPGGTPFATPLPVARGTIAATLVVPDGTAPGRDVIVACQQCAEGAPPTTPFTVLAAPSARAGAATVEPGATVTVFGENWEPGTDVRIYLDARDLDGGSPIARLTPDDAGAIRGLVTIPRNAAVGDRTLVACQACRDPEAPFPLALRTVVVPPVGAATLRSTPTTAAPGARVRVTGAHWQRGRGVQIYLDAAAILSGRPLATLVPDGAGAIRGRVRIPRDATSGPHQLVACQSCRGAEASSALRVAPAPPPPTQPTLPPTTPHDPPHHNGSHTAALAAAAAGSLAVLGGVAALLLRRYPALFRKQRWQRRAERGERAEPCDRGTWYCHRGEPELELEGREIREIVVEIATAPGDGAHWELALEAEAVEQANRALADWRASAPASARAATDVVATSVARCVDAHWAAVAGLADVTLALRVEGGELSHTYHLRHCRRENGDARCSWIDRATWTAKAALEDARTYRTAVAVTRDPHGQVDAAGGDALERATAEIVERIHRDRSLGRISAGAELEVELERPEPVGPSSG